MRKQRGAWVICEVDLSCELLPVSVYVCGREDWFD